MPTFDTSCKLNNTWSTIDSINWNVVYHPSDSRYKGTYYDATPSKSIKPKTELIKNFHKIIDELQLSNIGELQPELAIAFFTKYNSDLEEDLNEKLLIPAYYIHRTHPIKSDPQYAMASLFSYDLAVISDVLEYAPSTMARANIIKEALTCLKQNKRTYLIITAMPMKNIEESKNIVSALNEEDLKELAFYAGANKMWELDCMKEAKFPIIVVAGGG